ncbi:hypothetical protein ACHAWF_017977, partial [Thalassiosira exigua]
TKQEPRSLNIKNLRQSNASSSISITRSIYPSLLFDKSNWASIRHRLLFTHKVPQNSMDTINIYKQTSAPNETPAFVNEKLTEFGSALDAIDVEKRAGYLMAERKCPHICSDAFKLIFLRCEVFHVERAVERWVKYWNKRVEVFGEEKAFLPMTLDGAMKDDTEAVQMNYLQVANGADPAGRAILIFDHTKESGEVSSDSLLRVVWFKVHAALLNQESAQKRGVVVFVRCLDRLSDWRPSLSKDIVQAGRGILPVRFAGMHFMNPPKFLSLIMSFIKPLLGKKLRHRFYTHSGTKGEILESLSMFGLGTDDMLPVHFGGKLAFV